MYRLVCICKDKKLCSFTDLLCKKIFTALNILNSHMTNLSFLLAWNSEEFKTSQIAFSIHCLNYKLISQTVLLLLEQYILIFYQKYIIFKESQISNKITTQHTPSTPTPKEKFSGSVHISFCLIRWKPVFLLLQNADKTFKSFIIECLNQYWIWQLYIHVCITVPIWHIKIQVFLY